MPNVYITHNALSSVYGQAPDAIAVAARGSVRSRLPHGPCMSDAATIEPPQTSSEAGDGSSRTPGMLSGLRVIEFADETAEYCGLLLAGLGAEVVKVEPAGGSPTRRIGPFYEDIPDPERSLYFWNYNRGKRSVVVDVASPDRPRDFPATARGRRRAARLEPRPAEYGARPRPRRPRQAFPLAGRRPHDALRRRLVRGATSRDRTSFISRSAA